MSISRGRMYICLENLESVYTCRVDGQWTHAMNIYIAFCQEMTTYKGTLEQVFSHYKNNAWTVDEFRIPRDQVRIPNDSPALW